MSVSIVYTYSRVKNLKSMYLTLVFAVPRAFAYGGARSGGAGEGARFVVVLHNVLQVD